MPHPLDAPSTALLVEKHGDVFQAADLVGRKGCEKLVDGHVSALVWGLYSRGILVWVFFGAADFWKFWDNVGKKQEKMFGDF